MWFLVPSLAVGSRCADEIGPRYRRCKRDGRSSSPLEAKKIPDCFRIIVVLPREMQYIRTGRYELQ